MRRVLQLKLANRIAVWLQCLIEAGDDLSWDTELFVETVGWRIDRLVRMSGLMTRLIKECQRLGKFEPVPVIVLEQRTNIAIQLLREYVSPCCPSICSFIHLS